jgi:hypothetical protein
MSYITDLSFLSIGKTFPPTSQAERLDSYRKNRELYDGEHLSVFKEQFKRIDRVISNFSEIINYATIINYPKKISLKTADLICGEKPRFLAGKQGSKEQQSINKIDKINDLQSLAYSLILDVSRYGDGLLYVKKDSNGVGKITIARPEFWIPVVYAEDIKEIQYHVYAWTIDIASDSNLFGIQTSGQKYLVVQIHGKGTVSTVKYLIETSYNGSTIKSVVEPMQTYNTGLNDFAIIHVPNVLTSDCVTGASDYNDLDSIVSEIEVRLSQISKILDKHAEPSISGSASAITVNPVTGENELHMGNYFIRDREDPPIEYITWEAQLDANFKLLEKLMESLYAISEISPILFNDIKNFKQDAPSGTALKRMIAPTIAKVNRIKMKLTPAIIKAIQLVSQLGGKEITDLTDTDINIAWRDGLPGDPMESAQIMSVRTAGKQTISVLTALETFDELSVEAAEEELLRIEDDIEDAQEMAMEQMDSREVDSSGKENMPDTESKDNSK